MAAITLKLMGATLPMTNTPLISVVTSIYNGGDTLQASLQSVLDQQGVSFELIAVNDGSTDDSAQLLDELANADNRLHVIHQTNTGLTAALITGCSQARGQYIARHDAGDLSLPGKLAQLAGILDNDPAAVMASCGTRYVGPKNELLYDVMHDQATAMQGLQTTDIQHIRGPSHHGAMLFRRSAYETAGGYRPQFRVAQDFDLWVRLGEQGLHKIIPTILYQASVTPTAISRSFHQQQIALSKLILASATCRQRGESDADILNQAAQICQTGTCQPSRWQQAKGTYFIGTCLKHQPPQARQYYWQTVQTHPLFLKAWWRLLQDARLAI